MGDLMRNETEFYRKRDDINLLFTAFGAERNEEAAVQCGG
ncbi:hypothetical protein Z946_1731 [Sulfitobacter noctilucicola]|nr:hypothetical protein Z946_1731 [Sulfitobacter noctilucicola]